MKPPKMVHHDRLRRFEQDGEPNVPQWVHDAIASFERRRSTGAQTGEAESGDVNISEPIGPSTCVSCNKNNQDEFGIFRSVNSTKLCQLCR